MKLTFVPALQEDIPHIFQLNRDLFLRYEDFTSISCEKVLSWAEANIRQQFSYFRRILVDGKLAGFFCLCPSGEKWELDSLFVFPEYQKLGIGTQVVRYCLENAPGTLFLYVFRKNTVALDLYQKFGFRIVEKPRDTAYIMEYENRG